MIELKGNPKPQGNEPDLLSGSFSRGSLPTRGKPVKFLGEVVSGPVLTLGREATSTLSGIHHDSESQAIGNPIRYQASGDSVQRTFVYGASGVSYATYELN